MKAQLGFKKALWIAAFLGTVCSSLWARESVKVKNLETIKNEEFELPLAVLKYDLKDLKLQEKKSTVIDYATALRWALQMFKTDLEDDESPLNILLPDYFEKYDEETALDLAKAELVKLMNNPKTLISYVPTYQNPDTDNGIYGPEHGESIEKNWVIYLHMPHVSDHMYWVIIPRDGSSEPYLYGFN